jgi:hypothetical protein
MWTPVSSFLEWPGGSRWRAQPMRVLGVLVIAACMAGAAHAQQGTDKVDVAPVLRELEGVLAQPVYGDGRSASASKHTEDLESAPAAVVVRTGGKIRVHGYRTLAEVLDSIPGKEPGLFEREALI